MRRVLASCLISSFAFLSVMAQKPLPAWERGYLDIHHINTGRGNAVFCIFPDGTTFLIDAGELSPLDPRTFTKRNAPALPDSSRKPYQWITDYIRAVHPDPAQPVIDYALITHFHDDHFGAWYPSAPVSGSGKYICTGITGVGDQLTIGTLFDRGYPSYNYPWNMKQAAHKYGGGELAYAQTMQNYFSFTATQMARGMRMEQFMAGSNRQIRLLKNPSSFPEFFVQHIKANDSIWTGQGNGSYSHFPNVDSNDRRTWPDENSLSLALVIQYGSFRYYTGGDNPGNVFPGDNPLRDVETSIARVTGQVDVATMDHHGNRDAVNENMIRTLRPAVWIGQTWSSDHPGHEVLLRLVNPHISTNKADLYATNMLEANKLVIGPLVDRVYKSQQGHILVRVAPGGKEFNIFILDESKPGIEVKTIFGPYPVHNKY